MGARRGPQGRGVAGSNLSVMEMMVGTGRDPARATRGVICVCTAIFATDISVTICFQKIADEGSIWSHYSLRHEVNDLLILALVRTFLLPALSMLAHALWWSSAHRRHPTTVPLLEVRADTYAQLGGDDVYDEGETETLAKRKTRADFRRDVALALVFVSASACQGYIGVKLCLFEFKSRTQLLAALIGSTAALVGVEAWLLSNLVQLRTKLLTAVVPHLHKHALAYSISGNNWCDVCDRRILDQYMWRCDRCNFDVCLVCYGRINSNDRTAGLPVDTLESDSRSSPTNSLFSTTHTNSSTGHRRCQRTSRRLNAQAENAATADSKDSLKRIPPPPCTRLPEESDIASAEILRRTAALMAPDWPFIVTALICVFMSGAASLALPNFQGRIIDSVYQRNRRQFRRRLSLYLAFSACAAVTSSLRAMCFQVTGRRFACTLRNRLFAAIIRQDVSFFDNNATGTLTSRLTQDINQMSMPLTTLLGTLTSAIIQMGGSITMAFYTSWRLSMLAFTTVGPIMHVTNAYATWSKEQNRKILSHLGEANAVATEALANIRTVKSMGSDSIEIDRYESHTIAARDRGVVDAALSASTQLINNFLDRGAGWLILFYGGMLAMTDGSGLSAGKLQAPVVTYQLYFNNIQSSYTTLISLLSSFTRASGAAQRILSILSALPAVDPDAGWHLAQPPLGTLRFEDIHFAYEARPDRLVLRGFDLLVPAGSTLALVGKSGSGKTTALHLALRFYDPQLGCVRLDGVALNELNARDFRNYCSIVAQATELFDTTISANIMYGARNNHSKDDVLAASRAALAHEFISDFPNKYETRIGERGVKISGGQRQRISIARAFLRKPRLLFLDEATSALDSESEAKVQQSLDALIAQGGCTVLLVAHRLSTVRNADAIAVLSDGAIVELGNHDELMAENGIYATLVKRQLEASANALEDSHVDSAATEVDRLMALTANSSQGPAKPASRIDMHR